MTFQTVWSTRSRNELDAAWQWYENKLHGLGDRFVEEVLTRIRTIEKEPLKAIQRKPPFRESMVKVFPYLIIYRIDNRNNVIFIQSVFHTKRNPRRKYTP